MPNWCNNTLIVRGDKTEMESFLRSIEVKPCNVDDPMDYDFSILHPVPEDQKDDWYNWCNKNWGTKWSPSGILRTDSEDNPYELRFYFQTPWCPATNLFRFISKMYPHLVFYESGYESGVGFSVASAIHRGEVIEELGFSYSDVDMISEFEKEMSKALDNDDADGEEDLRQEMEEAIDELTESVATLICGFRPRFLRTFLIARRARRTAVFQLFET